jgi:methylmalonyl-CoA/ethylmalonyl-CoA epimerase
MSAPSRPRLEFDHVGIAVEDLEAARDRYSKLLGLEPSPIEEVSEENVRVCFFDLGNCRIELLEGTTPKSPVRRFLERGGRGVHHISLALRGGNLEEWLAALSEKGVDTIRDSEGREVRSGSQGSKVAFLHPRAADGVLIEYSSPGSPEADE